MKYRIAHFDRVHCKEVTGYAVPNDYSLSLFVHRDWRYPGCWRVSEETTGQMLGWDSEYSRSKADAIDKAKTFLFIHHDRVEKRIPYSVAEHGPISEWKLIEE